jgi:NAD(P)-dependent dehydrogenase (short-subunit alcohol dehydrogenase family)
MFHNSPSSTAPTNQPQGFEVIEQLLLQSNQPYNFILGVRNVSKTQDAYDALDFDRSVHALTILPLDLADLNTVVSFAKQTLSTTASVQIDYLFLNAGISNPSGPPGTLGPQGSKWSETYVVNHLCEPSHFPFPF